MELLTASQGIENKSQNIENAKKILIRLGFENFTFCDYSFSNGISVYFRTEKGSKIRVSDHGVLSSNRMREEMLFSFDVKGISVSGKVVEKCSYDIDSRMFESYKKQGRI